MKMYLTRKWDELMGPKDERLEAEENKATKAAFCVLLIGSVVSLYYWLMVDQVALSTAHPVFTSVGEGVVPVQIPLALTILVAGVVSLRMQIRSGAFSSYKRYAEIDRVPWGYVTSFALACGACVGVLTCVMRIVAEIQIVGTENVAWLGDVAIGVVFFAIAFVAGFCVIALTINDAIKRKHAIERELQD